MKKLLDFIKLTNDFKKIERAIRVSGSERFENDAEHSYQLALVAWYIITKEKLPLDISKVLMYSLVHDLVEIYAGDMPYHGRTEEMNHQKKENEHKALSRLQKEFPEFPGFTNAIEQYEKSDNEESRFVYALDKFIPMVNIYFDNGRAWKERKISLTHLQNSKNRRTKEHPRVHEYWKLFEELLVAQPDLFLTEAK